MLHLIIAISFSAMIPILLKYAHKRRISEEVLLSFNYLVAVIMSGIGAWIKLKGSNIAPIDNKDLLILLGIGFITGWLYYGAFFFYQKSVRDNGVSISIAVGKMGIVIPMVLSLVIWKEIPTAIQWIGISMSMVAIGLININPKAIKGSPLKISLILFFLIGGFGDFANKLFETTVGHIYSELFLVAVFGSALIASLIETIKKRHIDKASVMFGLAVGVPNMLTAYFLISALSKMKAAIVFPMYSGGAIVLSMLYSVWRLDEQLSKKEIVGISFILLALVLVNI